MKQRRESRSQYTSMVVMKNRVASPHSDFCESAQYLRSTSRFCATKNPQDLGAPGKLEAPDHLETMEILAGPAIAETQTNAQQR